MGLRFRKSIRILPGVKLNFNKKSTSVTVGRRGIKHTVNSSGRRTSSIGIPGTGISYSTSSGSRSPSSKKRSATANSIITKIPSRKMCKIISCVSLILFVISLFTFIWFSSELIRQAALIYVLPACLFGGVSVKLFVLYRRYAKICDWYDDREDVSEGNEYFSEDSIALEEQRRESDKIRQVNGD